MTIFRTTLFLVMLFCPLDTLADQPKSLSNQFILTSKADRNTLRELLRPAHFTIEEQTKAAGVKYYRISSARLAKQSGRVRDFAQKPNPLRVKVLRAKQRAVRNNRAQELSKLRLVGSEQNGLFSLDLAANDTYINSMWAMPSMYANNAWSYTTGSGDTVVAVIDTGITYTHPDLAANMWVNSGEIAANGIDDDANGYIDDIYGINAVLNNGEAMEVSTHGTHVAGTIAAVGNNGRGVVGVNWNAKLISTVMFPANGGGSTYDAIECINYLVALSVRGVNIKAVNASWGGGGYSSSLYSAIQALGTRGILFIASAGNSTNNNDITPAYPASYNLDNIISVAAIDINNNLASFSSFGATTVDLGAPGVSILSTYPPNLYAYMSGTSMAAPHVTGAVTLLRDYVPALTAAQAKATILDSVRLIPALTGKSLSGGTLNLYAAISSVATSPTPTPSVTPTPIQTPNPTPSATATPTPMPTATSAPTATPTPLPTATPTPLPSATPTPTPTLTPTPTPSRYTVSARVMNRNRPVAFAYRITVNGARSGIRTTRNTLSLSNLGLGDRYQIAILSPITTPRSVSGIVSGNRELTFKVPAARERARRLVP